MPKICSRRNARIKLFRSMILLLLVGGLISGCDTEINPVPTGTEATSTGALVTADCTKPTAHLDQPSPTSILLSPTATDLSQVPAPASTATQPQPTTSPRATPSTVCRIGAGLRRETASILLKHVSHQGLVMSATVRLAELHFPQLEGWTRVLGAPSLETLEQKAEEARQRGVPYEALGYGLETSATTPEEEWQNLLASTEEARALADKYGKMLLMGPGFRLMSENEQL